MKTLIAFTLLLIGLSISTLAADRLASGTSPVVAEVDGQKLNQSDFERKAAPLLFQARNNYYQAERKVLEEFVNQALLEKEALRENVTLDQLLERHVNTAIPKDPSDDALRVFYEGIDTNEPFEAVRDQILEHVRQRRIAKAKAAYVQSLRNKGKVVISMSPPKANIPLGDSPIHGLRDAPVMLVEYADYECPYCQEVYPDVKRVMSEYKDQVSFTYKDLPLPMHAQAQKAAEAAHCAGVQGKYWEFHDLLLTSKQLDVASLKRDSRTLNLNTSTFDKCLDSGEQTAAVQAQLAEALRLGLVSTPTFFVNGHLLSSGAKYNKLREAIEEELANAKAQRGEASTGQ